MADTEEISEGDLHRGNLPVVPIESQDQHPGIVGFRINRIPDMGNRARALNFRKDSRLAGLDGKAIRIPAGTVMAGDSARLELWWLRQITEQGVRFGADYAGEKDEQKCDD